MGSRDWLANWRFGRVLAEAETPYARAALIDTNGDERELWFGLDLRGPDGSWITVIDSDDVGGHHEAEEMPGSSVVFGWGTGRPRERRTTDLGDVVYPVQVNGAGWWLLIGRAATGP